MIPLNLLLDFCNVLISFICLFILVPQLNHKRNWLIIGLVSIISTLLFQNSLYLELIAFVVTGLLILNKTIIKPLNRLTITLVPVAIFLIIKKITTLFTFVFNIQLANQLLTALIQLITIVGLTFLGKYLYVKYLSELPFNDKVVSWMAFLAISTIIVGSAAITFFRNYFIKHISVFYITSIVAVALMLFVLFGIFQLVLGRLKKLQADLELQRIEEGNLYVSELEDNYNKLRRFKHDYKNLLLSLSASIENGSSKDRLEQILKSANIDLDSNFELNNTQPLQIKNDLVRGIVITKLITAQKKNIQTNTSITDKVDIPTDYSYELTRILGILFDNAIEATLSADEPLLNFSLLKSNNLQIIIQNSTANTPIDIDKIYRAGFSTKHSHSGLGLATVKKIINSHANFSMNTTLENNLFTTSITIE